MDQWPYVGRAALRAEASRLLGDNGAGGVILVGEAGVGKSRLAHEIAASARQDPPFLRVVASESARTIPFGALAPLLPVVTTARDPLSLLDAVRRELSGPGRGRLVWIEDAHHLDAGSATLVQQVVSAGEACVLATLRLGAAPPDALASLWRNGEVAVLEVEPLTSPEVAAVLDAALGPPVAASTAKSLADRSRGNPLLLRELVRAGLRDGTLARQSGAWTLAPGGAPTPALAEIVGARLGRLEGADRLAVELLSIAESLPVDLLEHLAGAPCVEGLEDRGVISVEPVEAVLVARLAHPLYAEVTRAAMPLTRQRRRNRQLAEAAETSPWPIDVLRRAQWHLAADKPADVGVLAEAALQALQRADLPLAERLAREARRRGAGIGCLLVLADVVVRQGRHDDALALLVEASAEAADEQEIADVADKRAWVLESAGRCEEARVVLAEASARIGPDARDLLDAQAAILSVLAGRPGPALETIRRVRAAPRPTGLSDIVAARLDWAELFCHALAGRCDSATTLAESFRARLAADPVRHWPTELMTLGWALALQLAGELVAAEDASTRAEAAALELGDRDAELTAGLYRGRALVAAGRAREALLHFERSTAIARALGDSSGLRWTLGGQCLAGALLGPGDALAAAADELAALPPRSEGLFEVDLCRRGLAWALAAGGRFDDARLALANALDLSDELGQPAVSLLVCHDLLRMGDTSRVERIIALASASFGPYPAAASAHARGVRGGSGDLLAQAGLGFEQCGAMVQAAEVAAAAAEAYRRAGKPRQATAQSARAATLGRQLAGVHTIGLARPHEAAAALSAREHEVAVLAAQRMAAADIAERLYLSRRTVENHLQRIYIKLGISSRAELELALGSAGPDRAD